MGTAWQVGVTDMVVFPAGAVYCVCSLLPVTVVPEGWYLICCYPVDMTEDGSIPDDTRYLSIIRKPFNDSSDDYFVLFHFLDYARPYSSKWITFTNTVPVLKEVSNDAR